MKKALAILSTPKTLYDFLWYYVEYGNDYEWDVLIHSNFKLSEGILEKTNIFSDIYLYKTDLTQKGIIKLLLLFVQMLFYALINKKDIFALKVVKQYVNNKEYDLYCVAPFTNSLLPGLVYLLGENHEVVVLEDGTADYIKRINKWSKNNPLTMMYISSYVLGKLGYADMTCQYDLKSLNNCVKCYSFPDKVEDQRLYKSVLRIREFSNCDQIKYKELVEAAFQLPDLDDIDVILYTTPITDFTDADELFINQTEVFINEYCAGKNVVLKRHPRDKAEYVFNSDIHVFDVSPLVPGELLESQCKSHTSILMFVSTIYQSLTTKEYVILYYKELDIFADKLRYTDAFEKLVDQWDVDRERIISI